MRQEILEVRDRLQEIVGLKQSMAERLGRILFTNYLDKAAPETSADIAVLAHNYEDIQTLVSAILDYDIGTGTAIKQLLSDMEGGAAI